MAKDSETSSEKQSKEERAAGVGRMLNDEEPPVTPEPNEGADVPSQAARGTSSVGESTTRRGEDVTGDDGKEAGRSDRGPDDTPGARPSGTSSDRDATGIDHQDSDDDSPPMGGQGG